jgi:UDP-N-acetylglucosamine 1-carboxyvinyltransferase
MIARAGTLELPPPGGDVIGRRRVDTHILALTALGAEVNYNRNFSFKAKNLKGADILLDEASVTATENAIMAAVTAEGQSIIRNAASEPHIQELCSFLNNIGATYIILAPTHCLSTVSRAFPAANIRLDRIIWKWSVYRCSRHYA